MGEDEKQEPGISIKIELQPVAEIIKTIKELIFYYSEMRQKAKENKLAQLNLILEETEKATTKHLDLIREITNPIIYKNDFAGTYERFDFYVKDTVLPDRYGQIKGILESSYMWKEVKKRKELHDGIHNVRFKLRAFQYAAFIIPCEENRKALERGDLPQNKTAFMSFDVRDHFERTKELYDLLEDPIKNKDSISKKKWKISSDFPIVFSYLQPEHEQPKLPEIRPVDTREEITYLCRQWFSAWQQGVLMTVSGDGISNAVAKVKGMLLDI